MNAVRLQELHRVPPPAADYVSCEANHEQLCSCSSGMYFQHGHRHAAWTIGMYNGNGLLAWTMGMQHGNGLTACMDKGRAAWT